MLVVVCAYLASCTQVGNDALQKALLVMEGASESELISAAGPPTRKQEPSSDCRSKGGARELVYEARTLWLGGKLASDLSSQVVVCIDSSSTIVVKQYILGET
jgi:hypothetical protein